MTQGKRGEARSETITRQGHLITGQGVMNTYARLVTP